MAILDRLVWGANTTFSMRLPLSSKRTSNTSWYWPSSSGVVTVTVCRYVYWSRAFWNSFSLAANRLMISSGVVPFGGVFSRGPSCARAGNTTITKRNREKRAERSDSFIFSSLSELARRWRRDVACDFFLNAPKERQQATSLQRVGTAATLPPTPLRSARPESRVLQFCHPFGCLIGIGVAVLKAKKYMPSAGTKTAVLP